MVSFTKEEELSLHSYFSLESPPHLPLLILLHLHHYLPSESYRPASDQDPPTSASQVPGIIGVYTTPSLGIYPLSVGCAPVMLSSACLQYVLPVSGITCLVLIPWISFFLVT
jgi:hypothetical protein